MSGAADRLREFVLQVIAERTMPRKYAAPDAMWLMPYHRIVEDREAIIAHFDAVHAELETLKRRVAALELEDKTL